jgi:predicted lysophospholipase L1 biosynthesis ABC-type transport system permease subunit
MARYYFPGRDPLGKHFTLDRDWKGFGPEEPYEIVGVVGDAHYYEIREEPPRTIYFDTFQGHGAGPQFMLRTSIAPTAVAPEVRQAMREIVKGVSVRHITTMADQVDASIVPERVVAMLSGLFGVLGSLLAALGLYGLLAYTVARRTNEIGIRMALGASRGNVARMVLRDALGMVLAGLAIGAPLAFWGRNFAASLIQDLPVKSIIPLACGSLGMIAVALLAAYLPARRATKVDPIVALRCE